MKKYKEYILLLLIILLTSGCSSDKEVRLEKKEKAPSSLSDFSQGLQEILNHIEEVEKIMDNTDIKMNEERIKENEKKDKKEEDKDKEEIDEKTEKDKEEERKEYKLLEVWVNIDKKIEEVHKKWASYGVEGMKKGIASSRRDKVEGKLNSLTKAIEERSIKDVYEYASQTKLELEPVFQLYKDEIRGNTNKISYYIYQSYLRAMEGRNRQAENFLEDLAGDLDQIRSKLGEDEEAIRDLDRLKLSIDSMKIGLNENSPRLYRIKRDIIINIIKKLEE